MLAQEGLTEDKQEFKTTGGMDKVTDVFMGLELIQGEDGIKVHQDSYIRQLIENSEQALGKPLHKEESYWTGQDRPLPHHGLLQETSVTPAAPNAERNS